MENDNFKTRLTKVKALLFDVDGVLTDGSITLMENGDQVRTMNIKDGFALQLAVKKGFLVGIISGGRSEAVRKRMEYLGVQDIILGAFRKTEHYEDYLATYSLEPHQVLYMGDDLPDFEVMQRVGVPVCPADAVPEIRQLSIYVSLFGGGKGCVRDVVEQTMRAQGKWSDGERFVW